MEGAEIRDERRMFARLQSVAVGGDGTLASRTPSVSRMKVVQYLHQSSDVVRTAGVDDVHIMVTCLGSSDQSKLENGRLGVIVRFYVLRPEFARCQIAKA